MNRKTLLRWVGGTALAGSLLTGTLALEGVFAQTPTPAATKPPATQSVPGAQDALPGLDFGGRGHRGGKIDLVAATASVTGLTTAEVQAAHQAGQTFAAIAEENGKTADDVVNAAIAQLKTSLDTAVAAGTITSAQADAQLAQATTKASRMVNQVGMGGGPGHGGRGGPGHGGHRGGLDLVGTTAEVTGLTVDAVRAELAAGKSLAQVAQDNGKTVDDVMTALETKGNAHLSAQLEQAKTQLTTPGGR